MKRPFAVVAMPLIACGLAAGWLAGTWGDRGKGGEEQAGGTVAPAELRVEVTTALVVIGELPVETAVFGVVRAAPDALAIVSTRAGGRVVATLVTAGQEIERGDVLVQLDSAPLGVPVAAARSALAAADRAVKAFETTDRARQLAELAAGAEQTAASAELARTAVRRLEPLLADGLVTEKRMAEARQAAAQAAVERDRAARALLAFESNGAALQSDELAAARAAAAAQLEQAQADLEATDVRAPARGTVTDVRVQPGENVAPGVALASLLVGPGRWLELSVLPAMAERLRTGAPARWRAPDGSERLGRVASVLPVADPATGLCTAIVEPTGDAAPPTPGLVVIAELEIDRIHDAALVPAEALVRVEDRLSVVLAGEDGHAHVTPVTVRGRARGMAAVAGDLHAGDRVVVQGGYNLPDDAGIVAAGAPAEATSPKDTPP